MRMIDTIFDRCGGYVRVAQIVLAFYDRVLQSQRLRKIFIDTDMRRLVDHQAKFMSAIMGGPKSYTDEEISAVHRSLPIDDLMFDEMARLLRMTLSDFRLDEEDLRFVLVEFQSRRPLVVHRRAVDAAP